MRTVTIRELEDEMSNHLQYVRGGEEIVVEEHSVPIARILPFRHNDEQDRERRLVEEGVLQMPEKAMDWDEFFRIPAGDVPLDVAIAAAVDSRGDR